MVMVLNSPRHTRQLLSYLVTQLLSCAATLLQAEREATKQWAGEHPIGPLLRGFPCNISINTKNL